MRHTGTLPDSWGRLTRLQTLALGNNSISGATAEVGEFEVQQDGPVALPAFECAMPLSEAQSCSALPGPLPANWGSLNVSTLQLWTNKLTGVHCDFTLRLGLNACQNHHIASMPKSAAIDISSKTPDAYQPVHTPQRAHPVYRKLTGVLESPPQAARARSMFQLSHR